LKVLTQQLKGERDKVEAERNQFQELEQQYKDKIKVKY